MSHSNSNKGNSRETRKPKGMHKKNKVETEYQRTRNEANARKHHKGAALFQ